MSIKLRISITKEVLEATKDCGICERLTSCAISYAVRDVWPNAITFENVILPFNDDRRIHHHQVNFIQEFDNATPAERAAMQPFSFEIEVPDEVIGEVNIEEIRRICEWSKTLELVGEK